MLFPITITCFSDHDLTLCLRLRSLTLPSRDIIVNNHHLMVSVSDLTPWLRFHFYISLHLMLFPITMTCFSWLRSYPLFKTRFYLSLRLMLFSIFITWCLWPSSYPRFKIPFLNLSSFDVISNHHHLFSWLRSYSLFKTPFLDSLFTWYYFR